MTRYLDHPDDFAIKLKNPALAGFFSNATVRLFHTHDTAGIGGAGGAHHVALGDNHQIAG